MAHFLVRWQFTDASAKALVARPHDRTPQARALIEGFSGKLHQYFLAFGEYRRRGDLRVSGHDRRRRLLDDGRRHRRVRPLRNHVPADRGGGGGGDEARPRHEVRLQGAERLTPPAGVALSHRHAQPPGEVLDELPRDAPRARAARDRPFHRLGVQPLARAGRGRRRRRSPRPWRRTCPGRRRESRSRGRTGRRARPSPPSPRTG